ncbi:MAG: RNA polymerase factor sigma-54 [Tepidimonas ignava]|uniref:RNA polymerase sigma-54 factor n=1 Tax=Tepidimonas ignava TaxID=114249 RepID=A0A4R3LF06_9BURK|nr:RNA polymerase factor sigma-54 [Tepidimonas ignava]MCX7815492.1 RNA polymerase factor sigma-54 [Tepidimonas ignava]TCS98040.1 RNA polymerase RpoN-/SigL-like sigma 54 subunit [Tepidimonas ignava]TSE22547.1 RNA polymerase sigma-54 factor [Tepidimonas ignava]
MATRGTLGLRMAQQLTLTPQLQQSLRLLQLSALELAQEVEQMLADNPLLELADDDTPDAPPPDTAAPEFASEAPDDAPEPASAALSPDSEAGDPLDSYSVIEADVPLAEADWSAHLDDDSGGWRDDDADAPAPGPVSTDAGPGRDGRWDDDELPGAAERAPQPERLQDHLHAQALALHLTPEERAALHFLIESLNDDGYLDEPLEALAAVLLARAGHDDPEQAEALLALLRRALGWLQAMDPPGVGARDLAECLRLQLRQHPDDPAARAALALCAQPLEWIARRDLRRLGSATGLAPDEVRAGLQRLAQLEPKPGRRFADAERLVIVPDVLVTVQGTRFEVQLNPAVQPRLRIHDAYARALRQHRHGDLQQRLQEARWFIKNLQQRGETLLRVARAIVQQQRSFFLHGEVGMRPLVLRDIASELGLHESTVSRVTTAKYMATPRGTFELKYFFGSALGTDSGDGASSTAVRALIRQMIADEDPAHPLSDAQIAERLKEHGIECARRTVAKYREALRIPTATLRRAR